MLTECVLGCKPGWPPASEMRVAAAGLPSFNKLSVQVSEQGMRQSPREQWCLLVAWCLGPNHLIWAILKAMGDQSAREHACKLLAVNRLRQKGRKFKASLSYIARPLFNNSNNDSIIEN